MGYGRMGKAIEAWSAHYPVVITGKITKETSAEAYAQILSDADVIIDFSAPDVAFEHICTCIKAGKAVVSGTTGWHDRFKDLEVLVNRCQGSFLYASNFSIGVNVLFALNKYLAKLMNQYHDYSASIKETHHIHKLDAPSGTAITLADDIKASIDRYETYTLAEGMISDTSIPIHATREGDVYGDHSVIYTSQIDTITLSHSAHSRDGFAKGALLATIWLYNEGAPRKGCFTMNDMMGL